jgi:hypothetical protein
MLLALFVLFAVAIAIMFKWSKGVFTALAFFAAINTEGCNLNLFPSSLLIFTIYLLCNLGSSGFDIFYKFNMLHVFLVWP